ncbi:hypothetical protein ACJJTC_011955 [Scirpophaga incertulas]
MTLTFSTVRWKHNVLRILPKFALGLIFVYMYCEYIIYYVTQVQCGWPVLTKPITNDEPLFVMILADTHLLGSRHGHWFDKWRREWQMHRAFQTAVTLHNPNAVFVLGDLFDEGNWCSNKEFDEYVERFHRLFKLPEDIPMYAVVGNHDIGFHYRITPHLENRFERKMDSPPVRLVTLKGYHFVLINSMAMEGDGCRLCSRAVDEIERISNVFKCSSGSSLCKGKTKLEKYSRPIIMQHYPLYRESDSVCTEPDAAPLPERNTLFEERWDCLSKESTEFLVDSLHPRAVFGGHTHHSCVVGHSFAPTPDHKLEFTEYTVPSFSWRNRLDPKYYLVSIGPEEVKVSKCGLPRERTLQVTAILMTLAVILYIKYFKVNAHSINYKHLAGKKM